MGEGMNPILQNIYEQPGELDRVLDDLAGDKLDVVRRICRLMDLAGEVVLTSMGSALYSCMPAYEALVAMGRRNVRLVETAELIHDHSLVSRNALYVLMSRSGESREVADFSQWLVANGYLCVTITMTPDSTMARHCTVMLHDVASYDKIVCLKAYSSMALCGLFLASMLGREEPDAALVGRLHAAFSWMEGSKEDILAQIEAIDFLGETDGFYLLSRAEGLNMMRSASLWLEETAKIPANVMSIDNFYHGPMELIRAHTLTRTTTTPVLLDVLPDPRSRMIWDKVCDAVPRAIYVGAHPEASRAQVAFRLPDLGLDRPWMMLVEALYFQLLSYQVALVNGIEPGTFFDEGWVVK